MHGEGFFFQALIYLAAAVVSVPIAKRLGLGSVLGYLIAGIVIGPFALGLVGEEGQDVLHFAEFGVVMMLFLIGLELQPSLLWRLRNSILGLGGLQVGVSGAVITAIALAVGLDWRSGLAVGLILSLSSTAIVLQTLQEKDLMKTGGGRSAFSVLLFQDLAVIPMLAILPLLARSGAAHGAAEAGHSTTWVEGLPGWMATLVVVAAVASIVIGGRLLMRPAFRFIARAHVPEVFTAAALLLVVGIALLMSRVGLSPALGTFLAGVVLATSEYRHELEGDIEPFKGLLLGLFFISVGASIDFAQIISRPALIGGLVAALIVVKFVVLLVLGRVFGLGQDQNFLFSFALAQAGEFAFVLFSFATQQSVLRLEVASPLIAVVALTMALTPLLMLINERLVQPRFGTREKDEREADVIDESNPVIIAGYGRVGTIIGRLLRVSGIGATVLEIDSDQVELLRKLGHKVFYGDASRLDLLRSAGAESARVLVIALDDPERILGLVETARKHFPHLKVFSRAVGRTHAYELLEAGLDTVYRETLDSSLRIGFDVMRELGIPGFEALRRMRRFRVHDEKALRELSGKRTDTKNYMHLIRQQSEELERVLATDTSDLWSDVDAAWDTKGLRSEQAKMPDQSSELEAGEVS
jgi:monovalent cation:proton antiporter-2 (CPA2) family protein